MKKKGKLILGLIILFGFLFRFLGLNYAPPALNWDEVSHVYNAYSILKTGKDEWGVSFPAIFRAYGDYKLPVYVYLTVISEAFFGLTEVAVRLPSVFAGTGTIFFTYLLVRKLLEEDETREEVALVSALLVSIEPWSLFLSRVALEANLAVFLIVAGVYFFVKGAQEKGKYLIISLFLLGLSVWTYNSARVFVPLLLISLITIYSKQIQGKQKKVLTISLLIGLVFFVPMFWQLLNTSGQARYQEVRLINEGAINKIIETRNNLNYAPIVNRLISNKVTYFVISFVSNYFSHFSPEFLFFKGGSHYQFNVPNRGLLFWVNLPLFLIGIYILAKNWKRQASKIILMWLILAPVASSLTREAPHALRAVVMLPIPMIISGYGIGKLMERIQDNRYRMLAWVIYLLLLFLFLESYLMNYVNNYRVDYSWSWQYGYRQVVGYVNNNYDKYDKIVITKKYGEPHEFILFYSKWEPMKYMNDENLVRFNQSNWWWVDRFDKFYFINDWQVKEMVLESGQIVECSVDSVACLLITTEGNAPDNFERIDEIRFLDGKIAFEIYEN